MKTVGGAYRQQRYSARMRGIGFYLTQEQWCGWWEEQLGPDWFSKRGCRRGQYVMARLKDEGDYRLGNIECILAEDNHRYYNTNRRPSRGWSHSQISEDVVKKVFLERGAPTELASKYGITKDQVYCIKTQRYFKHVTDGLRSLASSR